MSAQQALALPSPAASNTVVINARCSLRIEADQRVIVVAGLPVHHATFVACYRSAGIFTWGMFTIGRRELIAALGGGVVAWPFTAYGQQAPRVALIGWLTAQTSASLAPYLDVLRAAFAERGYIEGRNVAIVFRYGDDSLERVPELAEELVRVPVDLIMVQGTAVPVISKLGLTIPVVYAFSGDPVSAGLADSLARPRRNMTGLTFMAAHLNGKRLAVVAWPLSTRAQQGGRCSSSALVGQNGLIAYQITTLSGVLNGAQWCTIMYLEFFINLNYHNDLSLQWRAVSHSGWQSCIGRITWMTPLETEFIVPCRGSY